MPTPDQQYPQTWLVLPAAGVGSRMQADRPKQYLEMTVKGITKTVIEFTLDHLLSYQTNHIFHKVVVVVTKGDPYWQDISRARGYDKDERIIVVDGGSERCYSVLNALLAISAVESSKDAWVAVHDVARPCLSYDDLDNLFSTLKNYSDGGILATPARDTMKRGALSDGSYIDHTVDRDQLWHALTPQMFPLESLLKNLQLALSESFEVTDEASAMEFSGAKPKLVSGRSDNLKITRPEDLKLAEFYLNSTS
ncbi:MAG: 2-C-methyl-D-erythritol 4-phosphate cytidylyltransferase [Oleispira sp.]|nr:2-C-methyl-D-erythritol 4-phosphate cytidylyltransferase [Oleispira sp.]